MPIAALFDINLDGEDRGYEASNSEVLSIKLRDPSLASTVLFQVFDPAGVNPELGIGANPPRASKDAPTLTLVGATSGQAVSPTSVSAAVAVTLPGSGTASWIIRCLVNGGMRQLPNGSTVFDPALIYERGVYIPTVYGTRKPVATETAQFEIEGWAGALADHMEAGTAGMPVDLVDLIDGEVIEWAASQKFSGSLVLGTTQLQAVNSSPLAVVLGANVTRLYLFDGDADISSISGASDGRLVHVHVVSGIKRFTGHLRPGNTSFIAGARESFWLIGDGGDWIISATRPWFTPQAPGARQRLIGDRLAAEVHVSDWMTPAMIADANSGTKLFDMQPVIQAAIDWLLWESMGVSGSVRGRLRLPAGILRIDRTIHLNYGTAYRSLIFEGEGILRGGEHGQTGTAIFATFGDAPAIAVTQCLDTVIKQMAIVGIGAAHVLGLSNTPAMSHLEPEAWVDPALPASANSRYAPYAAIAIDPYYGAEPVVHYPDVPFPPGFGGGGVPQYGKGPSTNITVEDVRIDGFVVGVVLQPNADGSGDFVHLNRVAVWFAVYGFSWGNSQARVCSMSDCTFAFLHTGFTSSTHGNRAGHPGITVTSCHWMTGIQIFECMNFGYGNGPCLIGCFAEAMYRLGKCNGQSQDSCGMTFRSCEFGFSYWEQYGCPTWILEMEGPIQVVFDSTKFYNTSSVRGYLGFRAAANVTGEPARSLQFNGCEVLAVELTDTLPEKCAVNGTAGLVVAEGSTSIDRFSIHLGYVSNLDTNALLGYGVLYTEQMVAARKHCAPVYAKKLKALGSGFDPGIDVAWGVYPLSITTVVSTVLRIITITIAGVTTSSLAHTGGDVGDVLMGYVTGAAYVVKSRTGTTLVLEAMNGFDKDGALLTPVVPGVNLLYPINCRRYAIEAVLYGDITSGSAVVSNLTLGNGNAPVLEDIVVADDHLYVDQNVDQCLDPTDGSARLVSFNTGARTMTFAGNFKYTATRRRFGIFVRPAMPNA
jgi:hypothetical protein